MVRKQDGKLGNIVTNDDGKSFQFVPLTEEEIKTLPKSRYLLLSEESGMVIDSVEVFDADAAMEHFSLLYPTRDTTKTAVYLRIGRQS